MNFELFNYRKMNLLDKIELKGKSAMKLNTNVTATLLVSMIILSACSNPAVPSNDEVDALPLIAFQSIGSIRSLAGRGLAQPYGDGSSPEQNRNINIYFMFAPVITGFAGNSIGARVGQTYSAPCFGTSIDFEISKSGAEFFYDGTFTDGSGWLKTWYNPSTKKFRFEQFNYIYDGINYLGNTDQEGNNLFMHIVLYKKSEEISFGTGFKDYTGLFEGAWYFQTTLGSGGFQGSDSMELFAGPMSTDSQGLGFAGVNAFYKEEGTWNISSLEDFNNNKDDIYSRLSTINDEADLIPLPGVVAGMYDPALPGPFLEESFGEVSTVEEWKSALEAFSPGWAEVTQLVPSNEVEIVE